MSDSRAETFPTFLILWSFSLFNNATPAESYPLYSNLLRPFNNIGTGSFLPDSWSETYATADIIEYDGKPLVKVGREFLQKTKKSSIKN